MTPFYDRAGATLFNADCREALRTLPDESVQTVITSPPYWALRDYGTDTWEGGEPDCGHATRLSPAEAASSLTGGKRSIGHRLEGFRGACARCGALRIGLQLGLEDSPRAYVDELVGVFAEVHRVLRPDGTLWLNLGNCYAGGGQGAQGGTGQRAGRSHTQATLLRKDRAAATAPKQLVGIAWRTALALQDAGWYLRADIIWHKPNPMPEAVRDRPTMAHEYLFLLSKRPRYFYDADAIREPQKTLGERHEGRSGYRAGHPSKGGIAVRALHPLGANRRSVWTIAAEPLAEAHYASFPTALVRPCVLAGSRPGDTVLDPFAGSGTTLKVARDLGRRAIGIELNPDYCAMAVRRLQQEPLGLEVPA